MVVTFARLKLRLIRNGMRGRPGKVVVFVLGCLGGAWFALLGFIAFALPGFLDDARIAGIVFPLAGTLVVLGWLLLPLVLFGVDESLDPARFALLPLRRATLIRGIFTAALIGVPAAGTFLASTGMVFSAARIGGIGAGLVEVLGIVLALLLCVAGSRAVTSAFAGALRSRRGRDAATVLLAAVAGLLGPIQFAALAGAQHADWDRVAAVARVVEWTPFGAAYSMGHDIMIGRAWGVPVKLVIVFATIAGLVWWWSATLERSMLDSAAGRASTSVRSGEPVDQLMLPLLPRTRFGALTSREARYWWRETRRRANLITFTVVGICVPVMLSISGISGRGVVPLVGALAAAGLANQFGFEASAYAGNIVAGVPGRAELHSRAAGYSLYSVPVLAAAAVVIGVFTRHTASIPALLGAVFAAYGIGLAVVLPISVIAAYALPETTNPFAVSSGAGAAKGLIGLAALLAALAGTAPVLVISALFPGFWLVAGLPLGIGYGMAGYVIGSRIAGRLLDRRMPELLAAVTPTR